MNDLQNITNNAIDGNFKDLNTLSMEINTLFQAAVESELSYAIKLGRKLSEAKELVDHGQWGSWIDEKLPFSQRKADMMMQIYENYGSKQETLFGDLNSQTFANLGISQAFALLSVPENEREDFVKENDAAKMSVRELKEAIKERDAAKSAAEKAELENRQLKTENEKLKRSSNDVEKAEKEKQDALDRMISAQAAETDAKAKLKKAVEDKKAAESALKAAKENPEIPESKIKEIGETAAAEAKAEAAKEVATAMEQLKKAKAELDNARSQLKMSNPDVAEFGVFFAEFQEIFNKISGKLIKIRNADTETGDKLTKAISAVLDRFAAGLKT